MISSKKINIVFAVCHPDDEAFWVGGLISELSKIKEFRIYVICLSGNKPGFVRIKEFNQAKKIAGYYKGIILGESLRKANQKLQYLPETLIEGLLKCDLKIKDIDILITHSPYGDEHRHPHHQQAYYELSEWSKLNRVPFGFFSTIPIRNISLIPKLQNMPIINNLQISMFAQCVSNNFSFSRIVDFFNIDLDFPRYYIQFLTLSDKKREILNCYKSANLKVSKAGYVSFQSNGESLYLMDNRSLKPFKILLSKATIPGSKYLFSYHRNTAYNIYKIFSNKLFRITK